MRIVVGNGGWIRVSGLDTLPANATVYVRLHRDEKAGRLVPIEIYIESDGEDRLRGEHVRRLPLDLIEAVANDRGMADLRARMTLPGVDLGTLASHLNTRWDLAQRKRSGKPTTASRHRTWVEDAWWAQIEGSGVKPAFRVPIEEFMFEPPPPRPPRLHAPPQSRYSDDWYKTLATAYRYAVEQWRAGKGEAPAKALAAEAKVSANTVRSWIYRARKAGFIPRGQQGRAG